jgi:hypothetical protein
VPRTRVDIPLVLRSLVRERAPTPPWCLQARSGGDLGFQRSPVTQSVIFCPFLVNVVGLTRPPLTNFIQTQEQLEAVQTFWTHLFPPWLTWVLEYREALFCSELAFAATTKVMRLVPDATSIRYGLGGEGPYFSGSDQDQFLGRLPDTLAEIDAFITTFWMGLSSQAIGGKTPKSPPDPSCARGGAFGTGCLSRSPSDRGEEVEGGVGRGKRSVPPRGRDAAPMAQGDERDKLQSGGNHSKSQTVNDHKLPDQDVGGQAPGSADSSPRRLAQTQPWMELTCSPLDVQPSADDSDCDEPPEDKWRRKQNERLDRRIRSGQFVHITPNANTHVTVSRRSMGSPTSMAPCSGRVQQAARASPRASGPGGAGDFGELELEPCEDAGSMGT